MAAALGKPANAKKFAISEDVIRTHKCTFCNHLLSVPPVMISNSETERYKCGRCKNINSQAFTRIRLFEDIAQHLSFPCSYPECSKRVPWGHVEEHEANCLHRTIKCPIYYHNCSAVIRVDKVLDHFKEKHSKNVKVVGSIWEVNTSYDYVFLMEVNSQFFFVYILHLDNIFSVAVLALQRSFYTKFNVKLLPMGDDNCVVNFENLPVVRYDEMSQCYMCWRKKCNEPHHPFSTKNKAGEMAVDRFASKLKKTLVDSVKCPNGDLRYSVTFVADKDEAEFIQILSQVEQREEEEEETKIGAHVSGAIPPEINIEAIRKAVSCPYCMTYMSAPIFACVTGHTICNVCRPRLKHCPMCAGPFGEARIYTLEEMAKDVGVPCQYDCKGCTYIGTASKMYIHETECSFSSLLRE